MHEFDFIVQFDFFSPTGFFQYDHKKERNLIIYNQSTPLPYPLSNVKTKIHFIYGIADRATNYLVSSILCRFLVNGP